MQSLSVKGRKDDDMDPEKIGAVILAAGRSSRQNGLKPLLPIGPKTAIRHCMDLFFESGLPWVNVVVGHRADEIIPEVKSAGAHPVLNSAWDRGMFSSVQAGVGALPEDISGFFVMPADIPLVLKTTIEFLIDCFKKNSGIWVFLPEFRGRTGHPPLVRSDLRTAIACHDGQNGLRGVFDKCVTSRIPVPDRYILEDIDTPGQYKKVLDLWRHRDISQPGEAGIILDRKCR